MFHHLRRMGFDSGLKTLFQPLRQVVADLGINHVCVIFSAVFSI